ncbi:uncharacterized protein DS421_4g108530 [Arachis hypogaea]|uniref:GRF-type domain-containing protein n=1 Tax=Arachis hypogaea TaxID=3818 RepID=A0A445DKG4_ARAHY|nr:uncharacterized protein DS421_4g108530 [Arachis hypogaea]RYR63668.1 hypothetical protein Ahy_A04g021445 [Arachis hypogaea]
MIILIIKENAVGEGGEDVGSKATRKKAALGFDEVEDGDRDADWMASQGSRSGRIRTPVKEMVCGHGERPILRTSMTKDNPGRRFWGCVYYEVQDGCDFFRWADPEAGGALGDSEIARCRKKITTLKTRLKDVEWKLRIVAALGVVGWIGFLYLLLHNPHSGRHINGMHLIRR